MFTLQRFYNVDYLGKTYYNILAYSEQDAIRKVVQLEKEISEEENQS